MEKGPNFDSMGLGCPSEKRVNVYLSVCMGRPAHILLDKKTFMGKAEGPGSQMGPGIQFINKSKGGLFFFKQTCTIYLAARVGGRPR